MIDLSQMELVKVKIDTLKPYPENSRTHSEFQIQQIMDSMKEFGFTNPVLIDDEQTIIAGHCRVEALKRLGSEYVPCIVLSGLSEEQKIAYIIADNKLALNAEWDMKILLCEFDKLKLADYNLEKTGFTIEELCSILPTEEPEIFADEDACPELQEQSITKHGDIWLLGDHRLVCGDATMIDDVEKLLEGSKANMVFTDPPYNMNFTGGIHADGSKSFNSKHGAIKNDKMDKEQAAEFFDSINTMIKMHCIGAYYITFYRLGIFDYWQSLDRSGLIVRSLVIWNKGNHTLSNSDYMSMYEPIFYGWCDEHNFYGGNNGRDIWDISRTSKNDLHPTMKPVELVEYAINHGSKKGDIVLDLFGGSGTTLIASHKTNRKAYLMELDPRYCDVIINRWQKFSSKKAILKATGENFDDRRT